jgi:3-hydroxyacyl-CoA dehydrogenase
MGQLRTRGWDKPREPAPGTFISEVYPVQRAIGIPWGFRSRRTALACPNTPRALCAPLGGTTSLDPAQAAAAREVTNGGFRRMTDAELSPMDWPPATLGNAEPSPLAHVAQLTRQARNHPALFGLHESVHPIRTVGICGAGVMGTGIAVANIQRGIRVKLYDASPDALRKAHNVLRDEFSKLALSGHSSQWVQICQTQDMLADCDLLIESVAENRELKQRVFQQLAPQLAPSALFATNTSTIRLAELSAAVPDPSRFCGLHFCNPVPARHLVEIVRADQTSEATVASLVAYAILIDKLPIVVRDSPGFLVNRLLLPYLNEALEMVCQGIDLTAIDRAGRTFGMELGPFEMLDMIGVDTAMRAGRTLWEAFPSRIALTPVLPKLVKLGRLGRKTGHGFYRYPTPGGPGLPDPELPRILAPYIRPRGSLRDAEIMARLILPMLLEATRAMDEKVVEHPRDVDLGVLFGLAFPPSRGGLLYWADRVGAAKILEILRPLESLGSRMQPTPLLRSLAETGGRFYC